MAQLSRQSTVPDEEEDLAALAARVEALARALLTLATRASAELPGGSSPTQLRALAVAEEGGPCTLGAFAEALGLSVSSASRLVDRLVAAGTLDRRQSEANRREVTLQVTANGKRLLRRHEAARRGMFSDVLREMSATEIRALLRGLDAVQRHSAARAGRLPRPTSDCPRRP